MIEFREARVDDAEAVALLHAGSWRANYRGAFTDEFLDGDLPAERLRVWRERLANPSLNQFVQLAMDGERLEGFICAYGGQDPKWGSFVDNLHVAGTSKRSGIGSTLMKQTGDWLCLHYPGLGVHLWVLEANASARRFYEHLGARNAGISIMEAHGGANVRSCRYTWAKAELLSVAQR